MDDSRQHPPGHDADHPETKGVEPVFEQLFDEESSTLTYVLGDPVSCQAVIIDPVDHNVERDLAVLARHGLTLAYALETHAHADHITSSGLLARRTGAKTATPFHCGVTACDLRLFDGDEVRFGHEVLSVLQTPGHTEGSVCYLWRDAGHSAARNAVFTGDTLFIGGCGRTDFQGGDPGELYDSIHNELFTLPEQTRVYPGHDYKGQRVSTIGAEMRGNPRLAGKTRAEFIALMNGLNLPRPRLMDVAVPANRNLGLPHGA
jgi:glyoxylase-like metal-dependent hydrolase (beta-lactamase superfamily II)